MSEDKTIWVIEFDGSEEKWVKWSDKFYSRAVILELDEVLDGDLTVPAADKPKDELEEDEIEARKKNNLAYSHLSLACVGLAHGIIRDEGRCRKGMETPTR